MRLPSRDRQRWPADESTISRANCHRDYEFVTKFSKFAYAQINQGADSERDRLAAAMGISRTAALRRGVLALAPTTLATGPLADLADEGLVTPARLKGGEPPACRPVAPLGDLLAELRADRDER